MLLSQYNCLGKKLVLRFTPSIACRRFQTVKRFLFIVLLFFSSTAFSAYYTDNLAPAYGSYRVQLPYFNEVEIHSGDRIFDVRIIANTPYHDLQIINPTINPKVMYKIEGSKLQIALQDSKVEIEDEVVAIVIRCPGELRSLSFRGDGQLIGVKMDSSFFNLEVAGDGVVQLQGKSINLHHAHFTDTSHTKVLGVNSHFLNIEMYKQAEAILYGDINAKNVSLYDTSRLIMYWINSSDLAIRQQASTYLYLAGVTNILDAIVEDKSRLDARYLRTKRGFVITQGNAHADVQVSNDLNTQARGDSDIYFFKEPRQNNPRMTSNGAVLDMNNLDRLRREIPCKDCFARIFQEGE